MAAEHIFEIKAPWSVVFADSQSVISGLLNITSGNSSFVEHVRGKVLLALELGLDLKFLLVPSRVGIKCTEEVDKLATFAYFLAELSASVPCQDVHPMIRTFLLQEWHSQ